MAEVSGKKLPNNDPASADVTKTINCHLCDNVTATAYCPSCKMHLCEKCEGHHKKLPTTRAHKLLKGPNMPPVPSIQLSDNDVDDYQENCPDHQKEEIKFFCTKHENLCCVACTVVKHQSCKVDYIPDVSGGFASGEEYKKMISRIEDIERLIAKCQADINNCKTAVDNLSKNEIEIFRSFKAEIITYLNKREAELLAEIKQTRDGDDAALQNLLAQTQTITTDISEVKTKLSALEDNPDRLFISAKRSHGLVAHLQSAVEEIQQKTGYRMYELQKDGNMEAVLYSATGLGTLEDVPSNLLKTMLNSH